jgi:ribosomal-protein-alanine N-acetyltransferase
LDERVTLRGYRAGDVEAMYALDVVCFERVFRYSRRAMKAFAEAEGAVVVVAEAAGEMAGFAIAQVEGNVGYVVTINVAPEWRRAGLGVELMERMEQGVLGGGAVAMELHVFVGNEGAVRFYERLGYARVGLVEGFYAGGMDGWVYRKEFDREV